VRDFNSSKMNGIRPLSVGETPVYRHKNQDFHWLATTQARLKQGLAKRVWQPTFRAAGLAPTRHPTPKEANWMALATNEP
jgi:hypothetical protein